MKKIISLTALFVVILLAFGSAASASDGGFCSKFEGMGMGICE